MFILNHKMTNTQKTIALSTDVYGVLQEVKTVFWEIMGKDDISDEDVIATLLAGFVDWMQQQKNAAWGCCSDGACAC